jgi:hypothetical protein
MDKVTVPPELVLQALPDAQKVSKNHQRRIKELEDQGRSGERVYYKHALRTHLVGRNDPCPCKSGKKYKHCCETKRFSEMWDVDKVKAKQEAAKAAMLKPVPQEAKT